MNETDVRRTYNFLKHKDSTEIRLIDPWGCKPPLSYYASDIESFVEICRRFDGRYNIYVGMNEREGRGTKSDHVSVVNATVIDVDSIHPRDAPSTDEECAAAKKTALEIYRFFERRGKHPALAMSGNGWQIWMPLYIEVDSSNRFNVEAVIKDLQRIVIKDFSDEGAKVDNIGDLARIIKVIGTRSIKANPSKDRPNRLSFWDEFPETFDNSEWSKSILRMSENYLPEERFDTDGVYPDDALTEAELEMLLSKMDYDTRALFEGDWECEKRYESRSEAELGLLARMANKGFRKSDAWRLMRLCKIGKWNRANHAYRSRTIEKAYADHRQ